MQVFSNKDPLLKPHKYGFSNGHDNISTLPIDPIEMAISSDGVNWQSYYDIEELAGIYLIDWDIAMANPVFNFQKINTQDGQNLTSGTFDSRTITTTWYGWNTDSTDQLMAFHELQKFLMNRDGYWVAFGNEPSFKYRVVTNPITPTYLSNCQESFQVTLNNYTGMRESVVTTLETPNFDNDTYSVGIGLPLNDNLTWHFNTSKFKVFNPSDVAIDPLQQRHYLKIHVKGSGTPTLINTTTGDKFSYHRNLGSKDELVLDGVDPLMNGTPDGINSDHGVISLAKGYNEFEIAGLSSPNIAFEFYFVYL